jgi:hypothetical protein
MPQPGDLADRRLRRAVWILVTVGFIALAVAGLGAGYAIEANSQTNRLSDPFADIGVVYGAVVAIGAGAVTLGCWIAALVKHHQRPYDPSREWWLS